MIPAALIGILAISRLGAIHAVVFGGFAPASLAQRVEASKPVAILTASCGIDGSKPPMSYRPFIREAIELSSYKPAKTIIWQRDVLRWDDVSKENGERNWQRLVKSAASRGVKAECVPVKATDPIYIIYTSGMNTRILLVFSYSWGYFVKANILDNGDHLLMPGFKARRDYPKVF